MMNSGAPTTKAPWPGNTAALHLVAEVKGMVWAACHRDLPRNFWAMARAVSLSASMDW